MPDQVVPITQLADTGVILDTPPVSLPPNAFTNARNVRFKDGAVRKMEGEVDIFENVRDLFSIVTTRDSSIFRYGELQFLAWWPSPNQTVQDSGYYVFVVEDLETTNIVHRAFAMLPGATVIIDSNNTTTATFNGIADISPSAGYSRQGKWQHTLFNGGFTFILNNGIQRPQYITDAEGNLDVNNLSLADLPGWDSYQVNELLLRDTFLSATSTLVFDTGQTRENNVTQYIVTRTRGTTELVLTEDNAASPAANTYSVTQSNGQDVITFATNTLTNNDSVQVNFQSVNPVNVRAAIVRSFGDFLVAGNLVERDSVTAGNPIVRRLTGVVRASDVAQPGAIPNNWNPFAAGVSTADEFTIADTGTVQDMVPLQGNMYLYTNSSISVMRLTGNAAVPLSVQPVTDQYGALTTDAVLEYDGKHFVIGSDDIYLFGGHPGSIQSISDQKVRRTFFNRVNPINENTRNLFTLRYAARDEIWVCFPTVDSTRGESDEAYIWNYRNGTWTIRDLTSVVSGNIAPVPGGGVPSAIVSFTGNSGTDDVIQVAAQEVQTIDVASTATVGHASAARKEVQTFATQRSLASVARPAITTNSMELTEIAIGENVFAGPNPTTQIVDFVAPNRDFTYTENGPQARTNGGARLAGEYSDQGRTQPTRVSITANDLYTPSELATHSGTGDTAPITGTAPFTGSTFNVSSTQVPETSQSFSGTQINNPSANLIATSRAFTNAVNNTSSLTNIATADGGSFTFNGSGNGTSQSTSSFTTSPRLSNGTVTASLTAVNTTQTVNTPGQTVTFTSFTDVDPSNVSGQYRPRVPAGMTLNIGGATLGPNTLLSGPQTAALFGTFPNSNITTITVRNIGGRGSQGISTRTPPYNDSNATPGVSYALGANTFSFTGGGVIVVGLAWDPGTQSMRTYVYFVPQTTDGDSGQVTNFPPTNVRFGITGGLTLGNSPRPTSVTVGNVTATSTTTVQTVRLNSVANNTNGNINFSWAGGTINNISPGIRTVNATQNNTTNQAWSYSGNASGRSFTNNSGFEIANFNGGGTGNSGTLANGESINRPTRASTWSGNTAVLTVTNNNPVTTSTDPRFAGREGRINFTTASDTNVPEFAGGGTSMTFLDHENSWNYNGIRDIQLEGARVDLTRIGGQPVRNVSFTVNPSGLTSQTQTTTVLNSNDLISVTFPVNFSSFDTNYAWNFTAAADARPGETLQNAMRSSQQFLDDAADYINAGNVSTLPATEWTAESRPNGLRLTSTLVGARTVDDFTFTTYGTGATALTTDLLEPDPVRSGVGDVTAAANQLPINYMFTNAGVSGLAVTIPLDRDTIDDQSPSNVQVEERIVAALRADTTFSQYYTVRDHNDDPAIAAGRFDLVARALPGGTITDPDGTTRTMPTTPAVFSAINQQFGGEAALTASVTSGVASSAAPLSVTINTGQTVFNQTDGTRTDTHNMNIFSTHIVTISGNYPSTAAGDNLLNEQFRQVFRNAPFSDTWDITSGNTLNTPSMTLTSVPNADMFNEVTSTNATLTPYFRFATTTQGLGTRGIDYPTITLTPPASEMMEPRTIRLTPPSAITTRLTNTQIAEIIRSEFDFPDWTVQATATPVVRSGTGVTGNRIKLVKTTPAAVTGSWVFTVSDYGNTANTLSGTAETADGTLIGRLNNSDFTRADMGNQNNLDFRGTRQERSQPTKIIVQISNDDVTGGIQYIPLNFGGTGTYDPSDQSTLGRGTRSTGLDIINTVQSTITSVNRRISTTLTGNTLTILPSQFSGLASFVLDIAINNNAAGVANYNRLAELNNAIEGNTDIPLIDTRDNGGIQSTVPVQVVAGNNTQFDTANSTRVPNFVSRNVLDAMSTPSDTIVETEQTINTQFDPLRPWPTTQVNLNREYPIFATSILDPNTGALTQHFRGADIGFLFLNQQYESFIERIEMAITPEFDTEQIQALALWGDGGSLVTFGNPINQATLDVKMYGTDAPGETRGRFDNLQRGSTTVRQRTADNQFVIGNDYKIDMRVHGRFLNLLISDFNVEEDGTRMANPANVAPDTNLGNTLRGISWNLSGMQADIIKGGRR